MNLNLVFINTGSIAKLIKFFTFYLIIFNSLYCDDEGLNVRIRDHTNDHTRWKTQKWLWRRRSKSVYFTDFGSVRNASKPISCPPPI